MSVNLEVGDKAPDFNLPTNGGGNLSLSDLKGNLAVLYFYPKDNTPGCTNEAIAFTALKKEFDTLGARIVGISKDSVKKHDNFIAKHHLDVTLLADVDGQMVEAYGVWVQKKLYGREYMGIERATFLIDAKGDIAQIWHKVRVKGHAQAVLEAAEAR